MKFVVMIAIIGEGVAAYHSGLTLGEARSLVDRLQVFDEDSVVWYEEQEGDGLPNIEEWAEFYR